MRVDHNSCRALRPGFKPALLLVATALLLIIPPASPAATGQPSSAQALWAAYWTIEPGFTSTLEMKNNLVQAPLDLTVSLYFANGEEYPLSPITIGPRQTVVLDIDGFVCVGFPSYFRQLIQATHHSLVQGFCIDNNAVLYIESIP